MSSPPAIKDVVDAYCVQSLPAAEIACRLKILPDSVNAMIDEAKRGVHGDDIQQMMYEHELKKRIPDTRYLARDVVERMYHPGSNMESVVSSLRITHYKGDQCFKPLLDTYPRVSEQVEAGANKMQELRLSMPKYSKDRNACAAFLTRYVYFGQSLKEIAETQPRSNRGARKSSPQSMLEQTSSGVYGAQIRHLVLTETARRQAAAGPSVAPVATQTPQDDGEDETRAAWTAGPSKKVCLGFASSRSASPLPLAPESQACPPSADESYPFCSQSPVDEDPPEIYESMGGGKWLDVNNIFQGV